MHIYTTFENEYSKHTHALYINVALRGFGASELRAVLGPLGALNPDPYLGRLQMALPGLPNGSAGPARQRCQACQTTFPGLPSLPDGFTSLARRPSQAEGLAKPAKQFGLACQAALPVLPRKNLPPYQT